MKGSCIIDGIDIAGLGMFILQGGDYDFLSFPERREPPQNDWHEMDGVDADLSEVYFKEKIVTVRFYIKANTGEEFIYNLNAFYELVSAPGHRQLYSREFGKTFLLRYVSCPAFAHTGGMYKAGTKRAEINVEFMMDDPLQIFAGSEIYEPSVFGSMLASEDNYLITTHDSYIVELDDASQYNSSYVSVNGYDLSEFGIIVNQCYNTVLRMPAAKKPLARSFDYRTGLMVYPSARRTFEKKQLIVDCSMRASSRAEFYYNYKALFNNLSAKGAVRISSVLGDTQCYYSAMQNFTKRRPFSSRVFVTFSLVFTVISPGILFFALSSEDNICIASEDEHLIQL